MLRVSQNNQIALISGAGSTTGIGFAAAKLLAQQGAKVILTSKSDRCLDRAVELVELGFDALAFAADLTDENQVAKLAEFVSLNCPKLDILVNNAGMASLDSVQESGSIDSLSTADFNAGLQRNLTSAFSLTKALLPLIRVGSSGRIINVSSVTGSLMAMQHEVAYAAAKAGLAGFTKAVALDEAARGITVNAIAPGWIATGSQTDFERRQGEKTPLGRSGSVAEVAAAIGFLSSLDASYITGQVLVIDGGNSIAEQRF
ncbi:MAG: hypothetical protein RL556_637 [Actinomycetota bacterium]